MIITAAINERRLVTFDYDDLPRIVEPHAYGRTAKGSLVLRGFQFDGDTSRELGWKLFTVDKMEFLMLTADNFDGPRPGYNLGDKQIPGMIAQLDAA